MISTQLAKQHPSPDLGYKGMQCATFSVYQQVFSVSLGFVVFEVNKECTSEVNYVRKSFYSAAMFRMQIVGCQKLHLKEATNGTSFPLTHKTGTLEKLESQGFQEMRSYFIL